MSVPWQQIASSISSLAAGGANYLGAKSASSKEQKQLRRAQQIQQRNLLMNLDMYDPNRALGYGAMSDLATLYGYTLPEYATSQQLAADTTPLSPKLIKQYLKSGLSLDQIAQMGTLATPNAKQLKKLRKAGLTGEQIQQLMTPVQRSDYQGPLQGGTEAGTPAAGNMSRFFTSPDYQFRLNEGQRDIGNSFAARGGASSGNALKALSQFNQNLASGEYGNYVNRLMSMAGIGERSQGQISNVGTNTANQNSGLQSAIGDAQAAGQLGMYGALAQHFADLGNIWGSGGVGSQNASGVSEDQIKKILSMFGSGSGGGVASGTNGGLTSAQMSGNQLLPAFQQYAGSFSDVRVKADIEPMGQTPGGHNLYKFRYVWEPEATHIGVMAQEVEKIDPQAVSEVNGIKCVDYRRIR